MTDDTVIARISVNLPYILQKVSFYLTALKEKKKMEAFIDFRDIVP